MVLWLQEQPLVGLVASGSLTRRHYDIDMMSLLAYLDKWINERGSASILRDRITLTEQQHHSEVLILQTERDALAKQNATIVQERDVARNELHKAQSQIKILEEAVTFWHQKAQPDPEEDRKYNELMRGMNAGG